MNIQAPEHMLLDTRRRVQCSWVLTWELQLKSLTYCISPSPNPSFRDLGFGLGLDNFTIQL